MWPIVRLSQKYPEVYRIIDDAGQWDIERSYRDTGLREGWLNYSGEYLDHNDRIVIYYSHAPP